jgi:hypothetical protein
MQGFQEVDSLLSCDGFIRCLLYSSGREHSGIQFKYFSKVIEGLIFCATVEDFLIFVVKTPSPQTEERAALSLSLPTP